MPKKSVGFTLIELLVVIAIISILATISFIAYSGVTKGARDSRRQSEINTIAQALEIRYQQTSPGSCPPGGTSSNGGVYCPLDVSWFANNSVPTDPTAATTPYCIWYHATTNLNTFGSPSAWSTTTCPALPSEPGSTTKVPIIATTPPINTVSWKICAVLEKGNPQVYCVNSKQ